MARRPLLAGAVPMKRNKSFGGIADVFKVFTENDDEPKSELAMQLSLAERVDLMLREKDIWEQERLDLEELVSRLQSANRTLVKEKVVLIQEKAALIERNFELQEQLAEARGGRVDKGCGGGNRGSTSSSSAAVERLDSLMCASNSIGSADGVTVAAVAAIAASAISDAAGTDATPPSRGKTTRAKRRGSFDLNNLVKGRLSALMGNASHSNGCDGGGGRVNDTIDCDNDDDDRKAIERSRRRRAAERAELIRAAKEESDKAAREYDESYGDGRIETADLGGGGGGLHGDGHKSTRSRQSRQRTMSYDLSCCDGHEEDDDEIDLPDLELSASRGDLLLASFGRLGSDRSLGSAEDVFARGRGSGGSSEGHAGGRSWWEDSVVIQMTSEVFSEVATSSRDDLDNSLTSSERLKRRWFGGKPAT